MTPRWWRRALPLVWTLLALNAAVYAAWTLPRTVQHRSVAARARVVRGEVVAETERVAALRARAETIVRNDAEVRQFYARVGAKKTALHAVQQDLSRAARESGVQLGARTYQTRDVKGAASLSRFEMTMPAKGTYPQVAAFLDRVERMPHLIVVDRIALHSAEEKGAQLEITLAAYFRDEEAPVDGQ